MTSWGAVAAAVSARWVNAAGCPGRAHPLAAGLFGPVRSCRPVRRRSVRAGPLRPAWLAALGECAKIGAGLRTSVSRHCRALTMSSLAGARTVAAQRCAAGPLLPMSSAQATAARAAGKNRIAFTRSDGRNSPPDGSVRRAIQAEPGEPGPDLFDAGHLLVPGEPREDGEQCDQAGIRVPQHPVDPVQDPLLTRRQAHG